MDSGAFLIYVHCIKSGVMNRQMDVVDVEWFSSDRGLTVFLGQGSRRILQAHISESRCGAPGRGAGWGADSAVRVVNYHSTMRFTGLIFFALGVYFVFQGFTAEYFVDETEGLASEEDKEKYKATPFIRVVFVCIGLGVAAWGTTPRYREDLGRIIPVRNYQVIRR